MKKKLRRTLKRDNGAHKRQIMSGKVYFYRIKNFMNFLKGKNMLTATL